MALSARVLVGVACTHLKSNVRLRSCVDWVRIVLACHQTTRTLQLAALRGADTLDHEYTRARAN